LEPLLRWAAPSVLAAVLGGCLGGAEFDGAGAADAGPSIDCEGIPRGPFEGRFLDSPIAFEDFAFDAEGNLVGTDGAALFKSPYDGDPQVFVASVSGLLGMRFLPNGDLVAASGAAGEVVRIDSDGAQHSLLAGLMSPNGIAVDVEGFVYVGELYGNSVRRVDPATGDFTYVVDGDVPGPNGLAFSTTDSTLYVGGWGEGILYSVSRDAKGVWGGLDVVDPDASNDLLHGLAVDACDNVYVSDIGATMRDGLYWTVVYRIPAGGGPHEILFDSTTLGYNVLGSNLDFGSGIGGWDANSLYLLSDYEGVIEIPVGVPSKPRPFPPVPVPEED